MADLLKFSLLLLLLGIGGIMKTGQTPVGSYFLNQPSEVVKLSFVDR